MRREEEREKKSFLLPIRSFIKRKIFASLEEENRLLFLCGFLLLRFLSPPPVQQNSDICTTTTTSKVYPNQQRTLNNLPTEFAVCPWLPPA